MFNGRWNVSEVPNSLRYVWIATGVLVLALGVGFALAMPWATALWPWPDGRMSYLFLGAILAAMAAAFVWIGMSGEWGAVAAGAGTAFIMAAGMAVYLFGLSREPGREGLVLHAGVLALVALLSVGPFVWSRRYAIRDPRPMPMLLRVSYAVFVAALLLAAAALMLRVPAVFPWALNADSSVMFGWIFVGDAFYFLYSLLNPRWHNARAQLLSFLAYDLFLIPAFAGLFSTVKPDHLPSLIIYTAVLIYSALLAVLYLFVHPETRSWSAPGAEPTAGVPTVR